MSTLSFRPTIVLEAAVAEARATNTILLGTGGLKRKSSILSIQHIELRAMRGFTTALLAPMQRTTQSASAE